MIEFTLEISNWNFGNQLTYAYLLYKNAHIMLDDTKNIWYKFYARNSCRHSSNGRAHPW